MRLRSIYYSKLCFYPAAVSNTSWSKLDTFLSVLESNSAHDHWLLTPEFQSVKLRLFWSTPTIHKLLEHITFGLARRSPGWTWKTKETAHQFYLCKVIPADNNTAAENCRLLECINHHIPLMNAICPCGHSDSSTTAPWYSQHFSTSWQWGFASVCQIAMFTQGFLFGSWWIYDWTFLESRTLSHKCSESMIYFRL